MIDWKKVAAARLQKIHTLHRLIDNDRIHLEANLNKALMIAFHQRCLRDPVGSATEIARQVAEDVMRDE